MLKTAFPLRIIPRMDLARKRPMPFVTVLHNLSVKPYPYKKKLKSQITGLSAPEAEQDYGTPNLFQL